MITLYEAFRKFKSRLELNDREQQNATARHTEVRDYLETKFAIERSFLTGSYARYTKTKPLKVINNGSELVFWSERDGWGHYYLYGADGTLKNRITNGEFVAEDISYVD